MLYFVKSVLRRKDESPTMFPTHHIACDFISLLVCLDVSIRFNDGTMLFLTNIRVCWEVPLAMLVKIQSDSNWSLDRELKCKMKINCGTMPVLITYCIGGWGSAKLTNCLIFWRHSYL
eukprot:324723_1